MPRPRTNPENAKRTSFVFDKDAIDTFQELCRLNHTTATKELRRMVDEYNRQNLAKFRNRDMFK